MEIETFKIFGQIAGIGGLALAFCLFIFKEIIKKNIFSRLNQKQSYSIILLLILLTSFITLSGLGSWIYAEVIYKPPPPKVHVTVSGKVLDEDDNPVRRAHVIFDPLGSETWSKIDGSFSKQLVLPNLGFPITIVTMHDDYHTYETSLPISSDSESLTITLRKR